MKYWLRCLGLAAIIALINYYTLPVPVVEQLFKPVVSFALAMLLGIRFPDLDLYTPGLKHRSATTHSLLLPGLLMLTGYALVNASVIAGLAMGMAIHMLADVFPRAWVGGALVKMPLFGSLGRFSPFWLLANFLGCLVIALGIVAEQGDWVQIISLVCAAVITLWYMIRKEQSLPPLLAALMVVSVLLWNRYGGDMASLNLKVQAAASSWRDYSDRTL